MEVAPASEASSFGKYTLVAKLATGGMAEIFLARLHDRLLCIKRILPHLARDPQFVAMFLDEARVVARISHPNVCQVFELGEISGQYYIAMEYLAGVPLSIFRRRDFYPGAADPRLVAGFGVQACEGLHHAHQLRSPSGETLGLVHRDVSAQNLFVTLDGVVKLLDFGIAKVQDQTIRTNTGAVKGTYCYISPEQLRGETVDRRADVWALGAVLWECLAQRHLFKRETEFLTFQAITHDPIPDICEVRPDVPPLVGDVISRAVSRDREQRFSSARALGEALAQAVGPLGGPSTPAAIAAELEGAFPELLREQRQMLELARQGEIFDLEHADPRGRAASLADTPVSNLHGKLAAAQAEVAGYVRAQQAILSIEDDERSSSGFTPPPRATPWPVRQQREKSRSQPFNAQDESGVLVAPPNTTPRPDSTPAPRRSGVPARMAVDTGSVVLAAPAPAPAPAPRQLAMLPWIIAIIVIAVAGSAAVALVMNHRKHREPAAIADGSASNPEPVHAIEPRTPPPPATVVDDAARASGSAAGSEEADPAGSADVPDAVVATISIDAGATVIASPAPVDAGVTLPTTHHPKLIKPKDPVAVVTPSGPPGFITIDSAPVYAVIYIDGKKYGETPLVHISVPAGKHAVRAVSPSGSTRNLSITIESGKTAPVRRVEW